MLQWLQHASAKMRTRLDKLNAETAPHSDQRQSRFERAGSGQPPARSLSRESTRVLGQFKETFHLQPQQLKSETRALPSAKPNFFAFHILPSPTNPLEGVTSEPASEVGAAEALHQRIQDRNGIVSGETKRNPRWAETANGKLHMAQTQTMVNELNALRGAVAHSDPALLSEPKADMVNNIVNRCGKSATGDFPYSDPIVSNALAKAQVGPWTPSA